MPWDQSQADYNPGRGYSGGGYGGGGSWGGAQLRRSGGGGVAVLERPQLILPTTMTSAPPAEPPAPPVAPPTSPPASDGGGGGGGGDGNGEDTTPEQGYYSVSYQLPQKKAPQAKDFGFSRFYEGRPELEDREPTPALLLQYPAGRRIRLVGAAGPG